MVRPGRNHLTEAVEVDETYVGGPEEDVHGRETFNLGTHRKTIRRDGDNATNSRMGTGGHS